VLGASSTDVSWTLRGALHAFFVRWTTVEAGKGFSIARNCRELLDSDQPRTRTRLGRCSTSLSLEEVWQAFATCWMTRELTPLCCLPSLHLRNGVYARP
jgi:hypothetical protein